MNDLALVVICVLSVEIVVYFKILTLLGTSLQVAKKVSYILPNKNISDHWKESVIPVYALKIMKSSLKILLALLSIIFCFIITDHFLINFLTTTLSPAGVIESVVFTFGYTYLRKLVTR